MSMLVLLFGCVLCKFKSWAWLCHIYGFLLSRVFIGLMIGGRDGRIKIIGGDNIEGLLISPKKLPFKNLEVCMLETFVA